MIWPLSNVFLGTFVKKTKLERENLIYLANNIDSWIAKRINNVLQFFLTTFLLVQVSQAVIYESTSTRNQS